MASVASNYAEKKALENLLTSAATWVALCENEPKKTWNGTELEELAKGAELTYPNYARVEIPAAAQWEFIAGGEATPSKALNKNVVTLKLNTGEGGRSKAKWLVLCTAVTGGEILFFGKLAEELNIVKTITKLEIEAKKLEITSE